MTVLSWLPTSRTRHRAGASQPRPRPRMAPARRHQWRALRQCVNCPLSLRAKDHGHAQPRFRHRHPRRHARHRNRGGQGRSRHQRTGASPRSASICRPGRRRSMRRGRLVLPGGVDSHCHIEQLSGGGLMNADTFETATRSAAFGGTTSVISFAAQHRGASLATTVDGLCRALARKGAIIDYAFHLMVANPDEQTIATDLPALIAAGHRSVKVFMTYDAVQVDDQALLDVMLAARSRRRAGLRPCRKPRLAEMDGRAAGQARLYRAEIPRRQPSPRRRGRGLPPADRLLRAARHADLHLPRLDRRRRGGDPRGERARRQDLCRNLPALPADDGGRTRSARRRGREMDLLAAAARDRGPGGALARSGARRSPDPVLRSRALSLRRQRQAQRRRQPAPSSRSPTACRAWRCACRCCSTPWSRRAGSG